MTAPPADVPATLTVPRLLTIREAADILARGERTVQRMISEGELPAILEHGKRRVRADDLRAYIDRLQPVTGSGTRRRRPQRSARPYDFLKE